MTVLKHLPFFAVVMLAASGCDKKTPPSIIIENSNTNHADGVVFQPSQHTNTVQPTQLLSAEDKLLLDTYAPLLKPIEDELKKQLSFDGELSADSGKTTISAKFTDLRLNPLSVIIPSDDRLVAYAGDFVVQVPSKDASQTVTATFGCQIVADLEPTRRYFLPDNATPQTAGRITALQIAAREGKTLKIVKWSLELVCFGDAGFAHESSDERTKSVIKMGARTTMERFGLEYRGDVNGVLLTLRPKTTKN